MIRHNWGPFFIIGILCISFFVQLTDGLVIGLDLGSDSFKTVLIRPGKIEIVENEESGRKTHTSIGLSSYGRVFGDRAATLYTKSPERVYNSILSFMGLYINNTEKAWLEELKDQKIFYGPNITLPSNSTESIKINVNSEEVYPEELLGQILSKALAYASATAKYTVSDVAITVPGYWVHSQRKSLLNAAQIAGMNVLSLVNQNSAIAIKYSVDRDFSAGPEYVLFVDMGLSHTEATIFKFDSVESKDSKTSTPQIVLISQASDLTLGGVSFDNRIVDYWVKQLSSKFGPNLVLPPAALAKLSRNAKKVKEILSANKEAHIIIEYLLPDFDFKVSLKRETFESICSDLFEKSIDPLRSAIQKSGLSIDQISSVELFGGGLRIPLIQERFKSIVHPLPLSRHLNPDEAAAFGAALYGAMLSSKYRVKKINIKNSLYAIHPIYLSRTDEFGDPIKSVVERELYEAHSLLKIGQIENASSLISKMPESEQKYLYQGLSKLLLRKYNESIDHFLNAAEIDPTNALVWTNLGIAYSELNQFSDALSAFDRALDLQPNYQPAILSKVSSLIKFERIDDARSTLEGTTVQDSPLGLLLQGLLFKYGSDLKKALESFEASLTLDPNYLDSYMARCLVLQELGQLAEPCLKLENPSLFSWNNHTIFMPEISESWDNTIIFREDSRLGSIRTIKISTHKNVRIFFSYANRDSLPKNVSPILGNYSIEWPAESLLISNVSGIPMVSIKVELTTSGILVINYAHAVIQYYQVISKYVDAETDQNTNEENIKDKNLNKYNNENSEPNTTNSNQHNENSQESQKSDSALLDSQKESIKDDTKQKEKHKKLYSVLKKKKVRLNVVPLVNIGLTSKQLKHASGRIRKLEKQESLVRETELAKSDFESLIYDTLEKFGSSLYIQHSTEEERKSIMSKLKLEDEWINGEGDSATKAEYLNHRDRINSEISKVQLRISEIRDFPLAVNNCMSIIQASRIHLPRINSTQNVTEQDYNETLEVINQTERTVIEANFTESSRAPSEDPRIISKQLISKCRVCISRLNLLEALPKRSKLNFPPKTQNSNDVPNSNLNETKSDKENKSNDQQTNSDTNININPITEQDEL